jgi:hypothetical protein
MFAFIIPAQNARMAADERFIAIEPQCRGLPFFSGIARPLGTLKVWMTLSVDAAYEWSDRSIGPHR